MKKTVKIWLIAAISLVLIGSLLFVGVMTMLNWDFMKLSTIKYETKKYEIKDSFESISIEAKDADIVFIPSDNSEKSVICYEQKKVKHYVSIADNTLTIKVDDQRKWYEYIGLNFEKAKITVNIPKNEYGTLIIKGQTGAIEIPKDYSFKSIDIFQSTGDVKNYADAKEDIKIKTSTGDIHVENISSNALDLAVSTGKIIIKNIDCAENINVKVSTGKATLTDINCKNLVSDGNTGDIVLNSVIATEKFSLKRSTGDVKIEASDAKEIFVQTDTGSVTGTLLSEKIFIVHSDTGKVDVPKTANGGKCEITTDTGNIILNIK